MKKIDCLGDICPIPIIKTKKEFEKIKPGESVMIVTDHSCVSESIVDHFRKRKVTIKSDEVINGVWEIIITKN